MLNKSLYTDLLWLGLVLYPIVFYWADTKRTLFRPRKSEKGWRIFLSLYILCVVVFAVEVAVKWA